MKPNISLSLPDIIHQAIHEDMPTGDLTTESLSLKSQLGEARLIAKEDLVVSGRIPFDLTMKSLDPDLQATWHFKDGDWALKDQTIARLEGRLDQILKAERVALNFLGRLSGIATLTRCFVNKTEGTECRILDTRKTTPLLRDLEKQAVLDGHGFNHRLHLSEAILIKENHISFAGGLSPAVRKIRLKFNGPIEIEVKNMAEVKEAVKLKVDRILLDNMNLEQTREALAIIPSQIETEASGNMSLERISAVAKLGVDFISVGALTHSAPCADYSLLFKWQENS